MVSWDRDVSDSTGPNLIYLNVAALIPSLAWLLYGTKNKI
jgi:hypothetical protein